MSSIKKNFLYNVLYQILILIMPLITAPIISRALGSKGLGIFTYTSSIAEYFVLFSMLGFQNHGIRTISRVRDNKEKLSKQFWGIYYLQLMISLFVTVAYVLYIYIISPEFFFVKLIQVFVVASCLFDVSWFFFGIEQFKITVTRNIIIRVTSLIAIILLVKKPEDLPIHTFIIAFSTMLSSFSLWIFLRKFVNFVRFEWSSSVRHLRPALIFFIPNLAVGAYIIMDKVMLGKLSNVSQVAYYSNAEKITNIPMGIISAFGTVMLPRSSYLARTGDFSRVKSNITKSLEFNTFMASALMFGIAAIAPIFAPIFFGIEFTLSGELTVYLAITILFKAWNSVIRTQFLIPFDMEKQFSLAVIFGAVTNLILNFILIPKYNAQGAIVATIISEFVVLIVEMYYSKQKLEYGQLIKNNIKYLFIGLLMFTVVKYLQVFLENNLISIMLQVAVGGVLYLLVCFLFYDDRKKMLEFVKVNINKIFKKLGRNK